MRTDPLTGESFRPKRRNQKFANAINRMRYNNNLQYEKRLLKSFVDKALSKNFDIIHSLLDNKKSITITERELLEKGYDFMYFTHYARVEDNYHCCIYKYVILEISEKTYKIINLGHD